MKFSIITTTYNCEKYVRDTLEGVLFQKGDFSIEYILFDACSTDNTFEIIKEYEKKVNDGCFAGRNQGITIKAFQEKDNGMYDGISKGFKLATGDIVAYINGDDFYLPYAFSAVQDIFEQLPEVKWLTGITNSYNVKGQNFLKSDFCNFSSSNILSGLHCEKLPFIQQESCFWKKEILNKIDLEKFKKFKMAGDFYLWHEFAKMGVELYSADTVLSGFRVRGDNKSSAIDAYYDEVESIIGAKPSFVKHNPLSKYINLATKIQFNKFISNTLIYFDYNSASWKIAKANKKEVLKKVKMTIRRCITFFFLTLFQNKK